MKNHDLYFEMTQLKDKLSSMEEMLNEIKMVVNLEDKLWDSADIQQNWHVSSRTLATWRAKGLISYIQVGNKIWYPRKARDFFINKYFNKPKSEEGTDEEEG